MIMVYLGGGFVVVAAGFGALLAAWFVESQVKRVLRRARRQGRRDVLNWQKGEGA